MLPPNVDHVQPAYFAAIAYIGAYMVVLAIWEPEMGSAARSLLEYATYVALIVALVKTVTRSYGASPILGTNSQAQELGVQAWKDLLRIGISVLNGDDKVSRARPAVDVPCHCVRVVASELRGRLANGMQSCVQSIIQIAHCLASLWLRVTKIPCSLQPPGWLEVRDW